MSKRPRTSLGGLVKPAQSHEHISEHSSDHIAVQLHDSDVPLVLPEPKLASESDATRPAARTSRGKTKASEAEFKDYAHRSLYAKPETFDLIRQLAFEKRMSAQALYREGLFLMLRKHGQFKDKKLDDV